MTWVGHHSLVAGLLVGLLEQLVVQRGLLKEVEGNLKKMKGQPVALKQFLEEVMLLNCVLLPP